MALSDINEVVDRSIYEAMYQVALAEDLTPDRDTFAAVAPGYQTDLERIVTAKGFAVELFGAASDDNKDQKRVPRISYENLYFLQGRIGGGLEKFYVLNGSVYDSFKFQPRTGQLRFQVRLTAKTSKQDRALHGILARGLRNQSYIPFYNDPTKSFLITYVYNRQLPDLKEGLLEKIYLFEAHDLWEDEFIPVTTGIAKIAEIDVAEDQTDATSAAKTRITKVT